MVHKMASDRIPDGYYSCLEAFQKFRDLRYGTSFKKIGLLPHDQGSEEERRERKKLHDNYHQKNDSCVGAFKGYFEDGILEAVVQNQITGEKFRIQPSDWKQMSWPENPFTAEAIFSFSREGLGKFDDRTPIVERREFDAWLEAYLVKSIKDKESQIPELRHDELVVLYQARIQDWPNDAPFPSSNDDWNFLKSKSQNVKREVARIIRDNHAPESWKAGGRTKKYRNSK